MGIKGNDGRARRKALVRRVALVVGACACVIVGARLLGFGGGRRQNATGLSAGENAARARLEKLMRNGKLKRRETASKGDNRGGGHLAKDPISTDDYDDTGDVELILSASVHLVDIFVDENLMRGAPPHSYAGVRGEFCRLDWHKHKEDPSAVPMFRDLVGKSKKCQHGRITVDFKTIAAKAREHDDEAKRAGQSVPHSIPPTGVVFHESRCGSTLVANSLAAMDPDRNRVYSESQPPLQALKACGEGFQHCSAENAAALLSDVMYMMSRTNDPQESRVFFKIQSIGTRSIDVFRKAFPRTPWIFVYRDPVQVMMSHLDIPEIKRANCVRPRRHPGPIVEKFISSHGDELEYLSDEDYCAVHLATLCEAAVESLQDSDMGMAVNYAKLVDDLMDSVFPDHFNVPVGEAERSRILEITKKYSKNRGKRQEEWKDDSEKKNKEATPEIRDAADKFLEMSYEALETMPQNVENAD